MRLLAWINVASLLALAVCCARPVCTLLAPPAFALCRLPHKQRDAERARDGVQAWRSIWRAAVVATLFMGYCHVYDERCSGLWAARQAAQMQPVPFACLDPDTPQRRWPSLVQQLRSHVFAASEERSCADYIERTHMSLLPNPAYVLADVLMLIPLRWLGLLADAAGGALATFLNHFGMPAQCALVALAAALWWLWPLRHAARAMLLPARLMLREDRDRSV